jgi:large subunit ribosomal protein L25
MQGLRAEPREKLGKKAKTVRLAGFLPAVVYGQGLPSQPVAVPYNDFEKVWREAGESTLVRLNVAGTPYTVLIHDIAYDRLTDRPIHADFYAVRMDRVLQVKVPLEFTGESPAVKNEGGVLIKVVHEIEIEAMPADLPHALTADISSLVSLGGRIFIKDIGSPKGVKILAPAEEVVLIVEAPRSEQELAELEAAPSAEAVEVKTEQEVKKEAKAEVKDKEETGTGEEK